MTTARFPERVPGFSVLFFRVTLFLPLNQTATVLLFMQKPRVFECFSVIDAAIGKRCHVTYCQRFFYHISLVNNILRLEHSLPMCDKDAHGENQPKGEQL